MPPFTFKDKLYNNPVELSLDIIGGKWKMPIIWRLKEGVKRYGELRKSLSKITHKMLTQQLRELEQAGLISRKVYPEVPPKVEYSLTPEGETVLPIIDMLRDWGYEYKNRYD
ncbi:MAG: helix-turn-helix domain-containing protein [Microscillaceae bacterium]|nr:helix-turn-helix domain-containing protein [Microscillaceae bacterium]